LTGLEDLSDESVGMASGIEQLLMLVVELIETVMPAIVHEVLLSPMQ
jgi:hypothetical protein